MNTEKIIERGKEIGAEIDKCIKCMDTYRDQPNKYEYWRSKYIMYSSQLDGFKEALCLMNLRTISDIF